jgi:hypothetical protein
MKYVKPASSQQVASIQNRRLNTSAIPIMSKQMKDNIAKKVNTPINLSLNISTISLFLFKWFNEQPLDKGFTAYLGYELNSSND